MTPLLGGGRTDDVVGSIDLGSEIGVQGRDLRLRRLVIQPGGIVPFHSHQGRPALIITVSGEITEHRSSCAVPIVHRAGEVSREADGIGHYWVNHGRVPAVLLSADVKRDPRRLLWVTGIILVMHYVYHFWLVMPVPEELSHHAHGRPFDVLALLMGVATFVGVGGLWLGWFVWCLQAQPLLPERELKELKILEEAHHA